MSDRGEKIPLDQLGGLIIICPKCERRGALVKPATGVRAVVVHRAESANDKVEVVDKCEWQSVQQFHVDRIALERRIDAARREQRKREL